MRPHAVLCGLLEVEVDHVALGRDPDRHPQPVPQRAGAPEHVEVERARVGPAEQRGQRQLRRRRVVGLAAADRREPEAGELAGEGLRDRDGERVGAAESLPEVAADQGDLVAVELQRDADVAHHLLRPPVEVDHSDRGQAVRIHQQLGAAEVRVVQHDDDVRHVGLDRCLRVEPRAAGQLRTQVVLEHLQRRVDQPDGARVVQLDRVVGVRQPLHPGPGRAVRVTRAHHDHQVGRGVEGRRLAEQGPDHRPGDIGTGVRGGAHADRAEAPQRDLHR